MNEQCNAASVSEVIGHDTVVLFKHNHSSTLIRQKNDQAPNESNGGVLMNLLPSSRMQRANLSLAPSPCKPRPRPQQKHCRTQRANAATCTQTLRTSLAPFRGLRGRDLSPGYSGLCLHTNETKPADQSPSPHCTLEKGHLKPAPL